MNPFDNDGAGLGSKYSRASLDFFREAGKWAKFLAIMGFIGVGFMIFAALLLFVAGAAMSSSRYYGRAGSGFENFAPFVYLVMAGVSFMPARYMWIFSNRAIEFANSTGEGDFEESIRQIRNLFKYYGIVTIAYIALSIVFAFGIVIFASTMSFNRF